MKLSKRFTKLALFGFVVLITIFFLNNLSNRREIKMKIVENQWKFLPERLTIYSNQEWKFKIYNEDSYPHSFYIKELNINENLPPKKETIIFINSPTKGTYNFFCSTVCGEGHYRMTGQIEIK